jgi:hypothetical protein
MNYPLSGGPQLRVSNSIKALSKICDLYILNRDLRPTILTSSYFSSKGLQYKQLYRFSYKGFIGLTIFVLQFLSRRFLYLNSIIEAMRINLLIKSEDVNVVWFGFGNISYHIILFLRLLNSKVVIICDTDSVWSRFISRRISFSKPYMRPIIWLSSNLKRNQEKSLMRISNIVTAVSTVDADYYSGLTETTEKVHLFSNTIDPEDYKTVVNATNQVINNSILITGSFGRKNSSMNIATRWFINEVFPLILNFYPDSLLRIVGRNSEMEFSSDTSKNIEVVGETFSLVPYFLSSTVAAVPLKFESGTRFKIIEAGLLRTPVVTTSLGLEGLDLAHETHLLIADDALNFSSSILDLFESANLRKILTDNCYNYIYENNTLQNQVNEGLSIVKNVLKSR